MMPVQKGTVSQIKYLKKNAQGKTYNTFNSE